VKLTSYELQVTSYKCWIGYVSCPVKLTSYELQATSYELRAALCTQSRYLGDILRKNCIILTIKETNMSFAGRSGQLA